MRKKTKNPVFEQIAKAAYGVKYHPAGNVRGARLTFTPLVNCPVIKAVSYPYETSDLAGFAAKHAEKMLGMNVYYFAASQKSGYICILMAKNSKVQNPKRVNPSHKVLNPRFAVSLESQHGTKPVGIIEAANFLSAYNAAKKEYGPDIDVDVMNPIRRYVVTKRKKATHGRIR